MRAAQNLLPDKRDHDGVIDIVVGRVARCNIFESKLGDEANDAGISGFLNTPVCFLFGNIVRSSRINALDDDQCRIKHWGHPRRCIWQTRASDLIGEATIIARPDLAASARNYPKR